jgi:hypothetical protein
MGSMTERPRVLLTGEIDWAHGEWDALSDVATLEVGVCLMVLIVGCRLKKQRGVYQGFEREVQWRLRYLSNFWFRCGMKPVKPISGTR